MTKGRKAVRNNGRTRYADESTKTLDRLEKEVLGRLAMLAEGNIRAYDRPNLHRSQPESSPPAGASSGGGFKGLADYHGQLMFRARERGFSARLTAIAAASRDYDYSVKRAPSFNSFDSARNTAERDAAILVHFEGCRPEWPAAYLGCSASHVEKLRKRFERDAILGEPLDRSEAFAA